MFIGLWYIIINSAEKNFFDMKSITTVIDFNHINWYVYIKSIKHFNLIEN